MGVRERLNLFSPETKQQFVIGQPLWEKYLSGEEKDPKVAAQAAKDAVQAEIKKAG